MKKVPYRAEARLQQGNQKIQKIKKKNKLFKKN
jgi:hypothetical protein